MASRLGALVARPADKESEKGRVDATRVKRYFSGRAPEWVDQENEAVREKVRTEIAAPVIVRRHDDPRLRRLQQSRTGDREQVIQRHREIRAADVVRRRREGSDEEEGSEEEAREEQPEEQEEDEEETMRRRQAVRERLIQQRHEEEAMAAEEEIEEEEEESDEEESDEDDEDDPRASRKLLKPVFVPKPDRETIQERDALEKEEEAFLAAEKRRMEERKLESRQMVVERIAAEEAAARAQKDEVARDVAEVNTDDEAADEAAEYEAWKLRELGRIRRDREARDNYEREAQERARLKNMTEEERKEWERLNPKDGKNVPKKKWKFLQKYWHKGAYYQDAPDDQRGTAGGDNIFTRDYSGPVGEDKFDKSSLPKVMQVKNFGRSGRTKWNHLVAEDTTVWDDPWANKDLRKKYDERMGGTVNDFSKPKKFMQR